MAKAALATEVARINHRTLDEIEPMLDRVLDIDRAFLVSPNGLVALSSWAFDATGETTERAYALFGVKAEDDVARLSISSAS